MIKNLAEILKKHKKWLDGEEGSERADLHGANLFGANLRNANLRDADLSCTYLRYIDLRDADLSSADLSSADLHNANLIRAKLIGANLYDVDLRNADLRGADLDCASLPLCCNSFHMKTDRRIMAQIAYQFCAQDCDDPDYLRARNAILDFANTFHRVDECGKLEPIEIQESEETT